MFKNLNALTLGISGHQSEIIELALTYRFQAMDLDVVDFAVRAKLRGMPYARRLIDSANLRIGSFDLPLSWEEEEEQFKSALEKLTEYAQAAAEVGCTRCLATLTPAGDKLPYHENFEFHRQRLAEVCRALEPAGVKLGLGFRAAEDLRKGKAFQFVHELDALGLLVSMVEASNIGIVLDTWDLFVSGGSVDSVRGMTADQIVAVQIADMPDDVPTAELTETARLLPGVSGKPDTPAVLAALAEIGYEGPVSAKPDRGVFRSKRRDPIAKLTAEALNGVWQAAGLSAEGKLVVAAES